MRIGIDCRLWNESGIGRYTRNLVMELQLLDKENSYVLFVRKNDKENVESQISNAKFQITIADIRWHSLEEQVKFPKILKKEKLDLVHFPYFSVPIFYKGAFVITIHDLINHKFATGRASTLPLPLYNLKLGAYKTIISIASRNAKKIITVSNSVKEQITQTLKVPQEKIVVTYEGVDKKILAPNGRYENKYEKYFLYVGNAYPHKNLERLLQAFAQINKTQTTVRLLCVGKQDFFYKKIKQEVLRLGLGEHVIFLHAITDDQLAHLYDNALALVSPSLMEGFGLPVLEAMANECLVIASDIPVYKELCKDDVLYCDPIHVSSITSAMENVLTQEKEKFSKQLENAKNRAQTFSWEKMARETLNVYQSALQK